MGVTIGALLPIANPFSTAPVFAALTHDYERSARLQQAYLAAVYMACVLLVSLIGGALILKFFGISMPALRIAGGLIVARIGFSMLTPEPERPLSKRDQAESAEKDAIAFSPIAMPLLSGPGSIAVTISMATSADSVLDLIPIGIGIIIVALISWVVLRSSVVVVEALGRTGVNALTRLMGLILVCIGVQFVANGTVELLSATSVVETINDALPS